MRGVKVGSMNQKIGGTASDCGGEKDVGFYLIIMAASPGPE